MVDLLPTLLSIANALELTPSGLDGLSLWDALRSRVKISPRTGLVYNIDDSLVPRVLNGPRRTSKFQVAIREGSYKMIWGQASMLHSSFRAAKQWGFPTSAREE